MRIIVTGLVGQYAFGGVAWDYLQFVEGFRALGHDVFYLEDTETWPYDPIHNTVSADCSYNVAYLRDVMTKLGLGDRWIYRNCPDASYHGVTESDAKKICKSADLLVNVSGSCWLRDEYAAIPRKIFIDTDPMFTQIGLISGKKDVRDRVKAHDFHFTFAENIGEKGCRVPLADLKWIPTRQPIVLDWWPPATEPPRDVFTTVMNWISYNGTEFDGEKWEQKDVEFMKFIALPQKTSQKFEIAMGMGPGKKRPTELLLRNGWQLVEPSEHLPDPWKYRDYLRNSKAEWSVAKNAYVKSRSGWFSCRSACYLALGRPCVLEETGWSKFYPTDAGLLPFSTLDEAVSAVEIVAADYEKHCHAARKIAENCFDARKILGGMLEKIGAT
jgi:hypothetical protein